MVSYTATRNVSGPLLLTKRKLCNLYCLLLNGESIFSYFYVGLFVFRSHMCLTILNRYFYIQFSSAVIFWAAVVIDEVCVVSQCVFIQLFAWFLADASVDVAFTLLTF